MRRSLLTVLLCFSYAFCFAQANYQFGLLPAFNLNKKLPKDWAFNLKTESRQELKAGNFGEAADFDYQYVLTDISLIASRKTGFNTKLAGGYLIRFRNERRIHRLIQQFVLTRNYPSFRLAHRIAADQTFSPGEEMELRLRYRVSAVFPLSGQSIDPTEFYLKINHEYLNAFQAKDYDLEIRLVPLLGYEFTDNNKLEWGLDYRLNSFLDESTSSRFWININWFITITK